VGSFFFLCILIKARKSRTRRKLKMSDLPGFLSVRVLRGVNLVSRDAGGSDPYVVLHLDNQVACLFFSLAIY
jgi:hypothetical protein